MSTEVTQARNQQNIVKHVVQWEDNFRRVPHLHGKLCCWKADQGAEVLARILRIMPRHLASKREKMSSVQQAALLKSIGMEVGGSTEQNFAVTPSSRSNLQPLQIHYEILSRKNEVYKYIHA